MQKILSIFDEAIVHPLDDIQAHLLRYIIYLKYCYKYWPWNCFSCSELLQMQRQECQNTSCSCHTSLLQQLEGHVPCVLQKNLYVLKGTALKMSYSNLGSWGHMWWKIREVMKWWKLFVIEMTLNTCTIISHFWMMVLLQESWSVLWSITSYILDWTQGLLTPCSHY